MLRNTTNQAPPGNGGRAARAGRGQGAGTPAPPGQADAAAARWLERLLRDGERAGG
jgi:hypothetical protein